MLFALGFVIALLVQMLGCAAAATIVTMAPHQVQALAHKRPRTAAAIIKLRAAPASLATHLRIGCAVVCMAMGMLGAMQLVPPMQRWLAPTLGGAAPATTLLTVFLALASVCIGLGQLAPAYVGTRLRPAWLAACAYPWAVVSGTRRGTPLPFVQPSLAAASLVPSLPAVQRVVEHARGQGVIHPRAAEIIIRALTFGDLTVADVMIPRNRVHALSVDVQPEEVRRVLLEEGHSCMPVYQGTLDQIVGLLFAKDVLALAWERELIVLQDLLQPPYFAPEMMRAADLLKALQRRRIHFAIVVDELGGTAGIVTIEDLLEELVGEIYGERDAQTPDPLHREVDGSHLVQGHMPLRDLNRELRLQLCEGDTFSTLGGLCVSLAGRIPEAGAQLTCADGTLLEVMEASPRRVRLVRLRHQSYSEAQQPGA